MNDACPHPAAALSTDMQLRSVNPATLESVAVYPQDTDTQVLAKLQAAARAAADWRRTPFPDRAAGLRRVAEALRRQAAGFSRLMAVEMGKPVTQGHAEVLKCASTSDYFAEHAEAFLRPEDVPSDARHSFVCFPPLGVILAIMPWNFPFWQVVRCAAPALMAGNAVVLKHASNVTGCALALDAVFREALPPGIFQTLLLDSRRLERVIAHPDIHGIALTGSVPAGRAVAALAGAHLKKTVLELGGSDPYLILDDADLAMAARIGAQSRLINSGQSCIAAKRFLAVAPVAAEFTRHLAAELQQARLGDPLDPATEVGPLARPDLRDALHEQVNRSTAAGARLLLGGQPTPGPGAFYPPTLVADARPGMPVFDEETFGPVAALTTAADAGEAVRLANLSVFGLGAAVFTRDPGRGAMLAADHLDAGACFVNALVRSDPRLPFGGIKESGYGRELGRIGIREFVNTKTVVVA